MPTEVEEGAPSITEFHSSTHVLPVGQTACFTCNASGTPEPTVEWLHNGRPLERNGTDNQSEACGVFHERRKPKSDNSSQIKMD
ncbi:unnamed protein product [Boreogadus saida]